MSTVIKAGEAGDVMRRLRTVDLADHLAEAQAVIERARREAAQIVAQAQQQREQVFAEARQRGHDEGHRAGYEQGRAEGHEAAHAEARRRFDDQASRSVAAFEAATRALDECKADLQLCAERDLLEFAVRLARRLTFAVGASRAEAVQANFQRALQLVTSQTDVTVRVHPQDLSTMQEFAGQAVAAREASVAVQLVADESVSPGGCLVQTGGQEIDASLATQVDTLVELLLGGPVPEEASDG